MPCKIRWLLPLVATSCGSSSDCASYIHASIADMRAASGSGCFELRHVVVAARTPSTSTPRVYVQDVGGGDFSAIMAKCDGSSSHACAAKVGQRVLAAIDGAAVTVRGFYQRGSVTGFEELYVDDFSDEGQLLARPAPVPLEASEVTRDARARAKWFQVGAISVPVTDPWVLYDLSPAELSRAGPCPAWGGFAMIPASAGAPPAAYCAGTMNPESVAAPDPREILIGRQFYQGFWASTDCACWEQSKQHLLTPGATLSGMAQGILVLETVTGSARSYQLFQPLSKSAFPVTGG